MRTKIILLTSRKLYRQTEEIANALIREHEYSQFLEDENQKLLDRIQELDEKIGKLYDNNEELHASYMQLLDSNRSLEYMNDVLEGDLEHYKQYYGELES